MIKAVVLAIAMCVSAMAANLRPSDVKAFDAYTARFGKHYSAVERRFRAQIFARNSALIAAHNAAGHPWTMGFNQFSDLSVEEFNALAASGRKPSSSKKVKPTIPEPEILAQLAAGLPASVNWTAGGAVTPVQDQGQCGSCWAFTTVAAVEGAWAVAKGGSLVKLSEQQVTSCDKSNGNDGCNGGEQITALDWIAKGNPLCSEQNYPYTSGDGTTGKCKTTCKGVVSISKGVELPIHNMTIIMAALAISPISLSVDASGNNWQNYNGGVMTSACKCKDDACLDHAVTGVGYGTDAATGLDYYLIKNSWAASWGEAGYIRLPRGPKYDPDGQCGVQIDSAYAQI